MSWRYPRCRISTGAHRHVFADTGRGHQAQGGPSIAQDAEPKITAFFEQPYLIVRQLDRRTAEFARSLIWKHNVSPKDAVHLATALMARLQFFDTFDTGLVKLSGQLGSPPLTIGFPNLPEQLTLEVTAEEPGQGEAHVKPTEAAET